MKNISIVALALGTFLLASSALAQGAGGRCPNGTFANGVCVGNAANGLPAGTTANGNILGNTQGANSPAAPSGLNTTALTAYGSGLVFVVNAILLPVVVAIAFIVFLWGVYKFFILDASDETAKGDGRRFVLWGLVGFVVIFSVWGLVNIVAGTFSLPLGGVAPPTPKL